jgi:pre-mRNA-processing factor 6
MRGTEENPGNEEIWLEAIKLMPPHLCRQVAAKGVSSVPTSIKLWLRAAELETDKKSKRKVLRKALENINDAVALWKAAVDLEESVALLRSDTWCCNVADTFLPLCVVG